MKVQSVIFDFGGVLVRTGDPFGRREWETRLGLVPGDLERLVHGSESWIKAQCGMITDAQHWEYVAAHLGVPAHEVPQLRADYFRDDKLDTGLIALIKSLHEQGVTIGLLSNDSAALEDKLRRQLNIYQHFDAVIISAKIGVMKPNPGAYQAITSALGVEPAQCIFIDDNRANVQGAVDFGMKAIQYQAGINLQSELEILQGTPL